ncbi:sulfite exporter TauE/SafE family protein [Sneathiella sp. CAU 1612]|uniref:Probable membrane transporter protein n=1 Tax=Sneathiella sedimenti TaxID=2816034 RepID=A0ABS3F1E0_9PROT|nr:sulfite exporter TauE/SafE family protein [Sneathiella sedimenti]MBO0332314.1 sulfite exporter TauE/SafE family protein [Sneathiella sedimenti]
MTVYLPIAEISVNLFLILGMGGAIGLLSGMFGVGGGFLMTPLLIFIGIPPAVSVATVSNQITAASVSGVLAHWRRGNVDFKMGMVLLIGGIVGSVVGTWIFTILKSIGQVDLMISLSYVIFLGTIGILMFIESVNALINTRRGTVKRKKLHQHYWIHGLPFKMRFRKSKLYISALMPLGIGALVGILSAIMGVGGGFVMVPAMIYLLGMPTSVVIGTSLFQIIFVTANVTLLHAISTQTVDIMLALLLMSSSVVGAQIGTRLGTKLRGEQLRGLLALLVIIVCLKLAFDLVITPVDLYSLGEGGH